MPLTTTSRSGRFAVGVMTVGLLAGGVGVASAHGPGHSGPRGGSPTNGQTVHSTSTVRSATGYTTRLTQYGSVTAVSPTSLTVASADGYSATYVLNSSTKYRNGRTAASNSTVAVNDVVSVQGVVSGGQNVAQLVEEHTPKVTPSSSPTATSTVTTTG